MDEYPENAVNVLPSINNGIIAIMHVSPNDSKTFLSEPFVYKINKQTLIENMESHGISTGAFSVDKYQNKYGKHTGIYIKNEMKGGVLYSCEKVTTATSAGEFEAPYRDTEANAHVCKAAYDVLVADEGSKYAADNLLLDFFSQDALRFFAIFTGAGSINSQDYKIAYRKLDRGSWNTNATQVSYCISYNYI